MFRENFVHAALYIVVLCCLLPSCGQQNRDREEMEKALENAFGDDNGEVAQSEETDTSTWIKPGTDIQKLVRNRVYKTEVKSDHANTTSTVYYNERGQETKTVYQSGSMAENFYNAKGLLTKKTWKGENTSGSEYKYNAKDQLVQTTEHDQDGTVITRVYGYDSLGRQIHEKYTYKTAEITIKEETFTYYSHHRIDSSHVFKHTAEAESKSIYTYLPNGNLQKIEVYDQTKDTNWYLSEKTTYRYLPNSRLITFEKWVKFTEGGTEDLSYTIDYGYNAKGDRIRKVNHALGITQSYEYTYDQNDLLVKEVLENPGKRFVTEYKYFTK